VSASDDELPLVLPEPGDHTGMRIGLGRLTEDVGVDEILQSVSPALGSPPE
jgi:hypothetical protein